MGPGAELELLGLLVEDVGAQEVGGHEVGRELDAPEAAAQEARQGQGQEGLARARHAFEERVPPARRQTRTCSLTGVLAEDDGVDAFPEEPPLREDVIEGEHVLRASGNRR